MSLEESRRTQRPYRYGMILLCVGALVNWLGLAQDYTEPIRYTGVACILAGACLICTAMCCWLHTPNRAGTSSESDDPVHVISAAEERRCEKPPDYDSVAVAPPSYDDAIKLDPAALLHQTGGATMVVPEATPAQTTNENFGSSNRGASTSSPSSSTFNISSVVALAPPHPPHPAISFGTEHEKLREKPPPYEPPHSSSGGGGAVLPPYSIPVELNPVIVVPGSN